MKYVFSSRFFLIFAVLVLAMFPEHVLAASGGGEPWEALPKKIISIMTGNTARLLGIIVVSAMGFMAWTGKLTWGFFGKVLVGFVLVFGGTAIAELFIGTTSVS